MNKVRREYWVCSDCYIAAVNDDYSGLDYHLSPIDAEQKIKEIQAGLARLGWLSPTGNDDDFADCPCDCCRDRLHGPRHEMVGELHTYRCSFVGREVTAIGITYPTAITVEAPNEGQARLKIYDTHDHLSNVKIEEVAE